MDHVRHEDASELPEAGLQVAATRLSQTLLQKAARGEDLEANLGGFSKMVDVLCRLNREIFSLQKYRDECRRNLGRDYDPARIKEDNEIFTRENQQFYSDPKALEPQARKLSNPQPAKALPPAQPAATLTPASPSAQPDLVLEIPQPLRDRQTAPAVKPTAPPEGSQ